MDIKMCRYCKKSFRGFSNLCPECVQKMDGVYLAVRNHLDKNPSANIAEVAEQTGVEERAILYLIREGRIALRGDTGSVSCLKCGRPISSGRYCEKCKGNLVHELEATRSSMASILRPPAKAEPAQDNKSRIHVLKDK